MADNYDFMRDMRERFEQHAREQVAAAVPLPLRRLLNPASDEEDGDDEGAPAVDDLAYVFDTGDEADGRARAAAAYRVLGTVGDIVATHPASKIAYFGTVEALHSYLKNRNDLNDDTWVVADDPEDVLDLEYDQDIAVGLLCADEDAASTVAGGRLERAREFYESFHWGDKSDVVVLPEISQVAGELTVLGVGLQLDYGASKEGKWEEYTHTLGEVSGTYPTVYCTADRKTIIIHGGGMRVEGRGIVD